VAARDGQASRTLPGKYDFPGGMTRRDHLRILARKHRQWRIPITLGLRNRQRRGRLRRMLMVYAVFVRR
jgi:hypothetical protein